MRSPQEVAQIERRLQPGGLNGLLRTLERRARQPGANLYVIAGPTGEILAGNVASLQPGVLDEEGWTGEPFRYQRYTDESRKDGTRGARQCLRARQRPAHPGRPRPQRAGEVSACWCARR